MPQLIIDIETIGEDFDGMDKISQHMLTRWIEKTSKSEKELHAALLDVKNSLGFSPLTGQIVAIGVLDATSEKGAVYFQAPKSSSDGGRVKRSETSDSSEVDTGSPKETEENGIKFKTCTEKEMLEKFWELCKRYNEFITFNGRCFDIPFLMIRSAINKVKPSKNLLSNRYLNSQKYDASHIDLFDQLTFYGAFRPKGFSLHMFARAFGIESPKAQGVDGDDVSRLFKEKKFLEIAKYNAEDIKATKKLYEYWETFLKI